MPKFYTDSEINLEVDEFLDECSDSEINEVIQYLIRVNSIPPISTHNRISVAEAEFENAVNKLHGEWNRLSKEDEETIKRIASKF